MFYFARVVLILIAILTDWFSLAFKDDMLIAFAGWLFLPYTTLAYMATMINNDEQIDGYWIILLLTAVWFDLYYLFLKENDDDSPPPRTESLVENPNGSPNDLCARK